MQRIAFIVLASLGAATVCLAQDTARMEHVVQSYVSSGTFAGSVLVARGSAQLTAQPTGGNGLVLLAESETRFFIRDINLAVEFVRDAAGNVTEFVMVQGTSGARDAREVRSA